MIYNTKNRCNGTTGSQKGKRPVLMLIFSVTGIQILRGLGLGFVLGLG